MAKALALVLLILLTIASAISYSFLSKKIIDGEKQVAEGQMSTAA